MSGQGTVGNRYILGCRDMPVFPLDSAVYRPSSYSSYLQGRSVLHPTDCPLSATETSRRKNSELSDGNEGRPLYEDGTEQAHESHILQEMSRYAEILRRSKRLGL